MLAFISDIMEDSYSNLCRHNEVIISIHNQQSLEAIGGLRFALRFAGEFISMMLNLLDSIPNVAAADLDEFLELTRKVCIHHIINTKDHGPRVFLFKLLFRQYGRAFIHPITTEHPGLYWLLPENALRDYRVSYNQLPTF